MTTAGAGSSRVETLSVLFTDVVGSTEHRVRVGEEEADRFRVGLDRVTRAAVLSRGGRVVKHTGDGMMATFSGASDALAAAVAMQRAISSERMALGGGAAVRIGISAGDVTVENDDCFGIAVVEAQRLESAARPGQILCSVLVRALARGRGGVELRPVGALELKGLDGPLEADEVLWSSPSASAADRLPPMLAAREVIPLAGRAAELDVLRAAWNAVSVGENRLALIGGEPGIGKTRLAIEVAQAAAATGGFVLAGRCDELVPLPHQPFVEALEWHLTQPGGTALLGDAPGELARLTARLAAIVRGLPAPLSATPDAERMALFDAVGSWLANVTEVGPVLLMIDDLHWAEMGTLLLVRHLTVTQPVPNLFVLATYRDTELARTHPLATMLAELGRRADVTRVVLDGLTADDVTEIVTHVTANELGDTGSALACAVHGETGGNPFFVGEMLRHLVEDGQLARRDGRWTASTIGGDLPEGVRQVVGRRVGVLPEPTQRILHLASVIGAQFTLELLAAAAGESEDVVLDALEPATAAHLLVEDGIERFRFAHAIVRSTLQQELSSTRRCRVHRAVAVALEGALERARPDDRDSFIPDLAYHWSEAEPTGGSFESVRYVQRAAELAFDRIVPEEAARWYRRARELLDGADPNLDAELLYKVGEAECLAAEPGWQRTLLDAAKAAEQLGDISTMVDALCISRRTNYSQINPDGADPEKIDLLERALVLAEPDSPLRARVAAALAVELTYVGDSARRLALVAEGRRIAETLADPIEKFRLVTSGSVAGGFAHLGRDALEKELDELEQLLVLTRNDGDHDSEALALRNLFYVGVIGGCPNRHRIIAEMDDLLSRYRHPFVSDTLLSIRVTTALIDGDLDAAERASRELSRQWVAHDRAGERAVFVAGVRSQLARERTGIGGLVEPIRASRDAAPDLPGPGTLDGLLALALYEAGRADEALELLVDNSHNDFVDIPDDGARPVAVAMWCEVAAALRDRRSAFALHRLLAPTHDLHLATGGWYLGSTARYLALLDVAVGRTEDAERWFAEAEEAHRSIESPPWLARTLLDRAELLVFDRDPRGAADLASHALVAIGDRPLEVSRSRAAALTANP